jgi:hypothetical protein
MRAHEADRSPCLTTLTGGQPDAFIELLLEGLLAHQHHRHRLLSLPHMHQHFLAGVQGAVPRPDIQLKQLHPGELQSIQQPRHQLGTRRLVHIKRLVDHEDHGLQQQQQQQQQPYEQ